MTAIADGDALIAASARPRSRRPRSRGRAIVADLVLALCALLAASLVIFLALHYLPGDIAAIMAGTDASAEKIDAIRRELGLDRPVMVQYWDWFTDLLRLDFGQSSLTHQAVGSELLRKLAVTAPMALAALVLAMLISIPLGIAAALGRRSWWGQLLHSLTQLGIAIPTFILGILFADLLAIRTGWLPATGFPIDGWRDFGAAMRSLILPTLTLTIPQAAVLIRFVRSATIETLSQDHVRTARAQGLSIRQALGQSWRMIGLPLSAVVALEFAGLLTGSVLVEQVFALPGVGQFLLSSVSVRDITVVQSVLMLMSALIIIMMTLANLVQQLLDPRLRS